MDLFIFDLDGTLIDSKLDLAHAVNATRAHLGKSPLAHELIFSYVGNGAPMLIRRAFPDASEEQLATALQHFMDYYREHMLDYTVLYPGVRETLAKLDNGNRRLAVLTNKPVRMSAAILDGLDVGKHFFRVYGGNSFEQKKPDPIGIETLLREAGARKERTVMVGDSAVDVQTARNAGISCCGVTYGFQPDSLDENPPDFVIERMDQIFAALQLS
jgi:phosphoglycolate phosphatase